MLLVGIAPPENLVIDWINNVERDDDLQNWVGGSGGGFWWAQNIALLDAAEVMASNPIEGEPCKIDYSVNQQPAGHG